MSPPVSPPEPPTPPHTTGWHARLDVAWARRPAPDGPRTVPIHRAHVGPLRVLRHHHPDADDRCQQVLVHPPGGMVGGDRLDITLAARDRADILVTTPGAAKWYRTIAGPASQYLETRVAADATLQLVPQPTIVFDGADVVLRTVHRLEPGARFLTWDILALGGRHGLPLAAGRVRAHTALHIGASLQYHETLAFRAADLFTASPLGLGGASVVATMLATAPPGPSTGPSKGPSTGPSTGPTIDNINDARDLARTIPLPPGLRAASTVLSGHQPLLVVRALGTCADTVFRWCCDVRNAIAPAILGRPAATPRIWYT